MRASRILVAALGAALGANPAAAIDDLSGEWSGKIACDLTSASGTTRSKEDTTLLVHDTGDGHAFALLEDVKVPFTLAVAAPDAKPTARLGGHKCDFNAAGGVVFEASVKIKPGSAKGTMSAELLSYNLALMGPTVTVCRLTLKRVGPTMAAPTDCP